MNGETRDTKNWRKKKSMKGEQRNLKFEEYIFAGREKYERRTKKSKVLKNIYLLEKKSMKGEQRNLKF